MLDKDLLISALMSDKAALEDSIKIATISGKIEVINQCLGALRSGNFDSKKEEENKGVVIDESETCQDELTNNLLSEPECFRIIRESIDSIKENNYSKQQTIDRLSEILDKINEEEKKESLENVDESQKECSKILSKAIEDAKEINNDLKEILQTHKG